MRIDGSWSSHTMLPCTEASSATDVRTQVPPPLPRPTCPEVSAPPALSAAPSVPGLSVLARRLPRLPAELVDARRDPPPTELLLPRDAVSVSRAMRSRALFAAATTRPVKAAAAPPSRERMGAAPTDRSPATLSMGCRPSVMTSTPLLLALLVRARVLLPPGDDGPPCTRPAASGSGGDAQPLAAPLAALPALAQRRCAAPAPRPALPPAPAAAAAAEVPADTRRQPAAYRSEITDCSSGAAWWPSNEHIMLDHSAPQLLTSGPASPLIAILWDTLRPKARALA